MFEFHGWVTIRETYEVRDDEEEGLDLLIEKIKSRIKELKWNTPELKARNGEFYIEISLYANRKTEETTELLNFFTDVAEMAIGSYGLIYMHDDEDRNGKDNEFQVLAIIRGKLQEYKDTFLSPFIPTVEDADF